MPVITWKYVESYVADLVSFRTSGQSAGFRPSEHYNPSNNSSATGRLPADWLEKFTSDAREFGIAYVVMSYATPVAWVTDDRQYVVPNVNYSPTTSKLQNAVRRAWEGRAIQTVLPVD